MLLSGFLFETMFPRLVFGSPSPPPRGLPHLPQQLGLQLCDTRYSSVLYWKHQNSPTSGPLFKLNFSTAVLLTPGHSVQILFSWERAPAILSSFGYQPISTSFLFHHLLFFLEIYLLLPGVVAYVFVFNPNTLERWRQGCLYEFETSLVCLGVLPACVAKHDAVPQEARGGRQIP